MLDTQMLIGSKFVDRHRSAGSVLNPKTEETIVELPEASPAQIDAAVDAAEKAFKTWSRTTPAERSALLLKLADAIEEDAEAFATLEALNCGKPSIARAAATRCPAIVDCFRFFAGAVRTHAWHRGRRISGGPHLDDPPRSDRRRRLDRAVELSADDGRLEARPGAGRRQHRRHQAVRADAADHAEACASYRRHLSRRCRQRRGRPGRNRRQRADQPSQGRDDLADRRYRYRQEGAAGRRQTHQAHPSRARRQGAGHRLRRCRHRCSRRGREGFGYYNAGQDCTAACRIYAGKKVYDNLVADLSAAVRGIKFNAADDDENDIGPLISRRQRDARRLLRRAGGELKHIEITDRRQGAAGKGFFYEPTVIAGAMQDDEIVRREVFGPVVSVTRFDDARRRSHGRMTATTAWLPRCGPRMSARACRPPRRLQYGCTWVNCHFMLVNEMPHGGLKQSGYGKDLSMYALEDYTVVRHVMVKL